MKVLIIESELGWGSKVVEVKEFVDRQSAEAFVRDYNEKYCPPLPRGQVPDWYMYARLDD